MRKESPSKLISRHKVKIATNIISLLDQKWASPAPDLDLAVKRLQSPSALQSPPDNEEDLDPYSYDQYMCERLSQYLEDLNSINSDLKKLRSTRIFNISLLRKKADSRTRTHSSMRGAGGSKNTKTWLTGSPNYSKSGFHNALLQVPRKSAPGLPKLLNVRVLQAAVMGKGRKNTSSTPVLAPIVGRTGSAMKAFSRPISRASSSRPSNKVTNKLKQLQHKPI